MCIRDSVYGIWIHYIGLWYHVMLLVVFVVIIIIIIVDSNSDYYDDDVWIIHGALTCRCRQHSVVLTSARAVVNTSTRLTSRRCLITSAIRCLTTAIPTPQKYALFAPNFVLFCSCWNRCDQSENYTWGLPAEVRVTVNRMLQGGIFLCHQKVVTSQASQVRSCHYCLLAKWSRPGLNNRQWGALKYCSKM